MGLLAELESLAKSYAEELAEHGEKQNEIADAQDHVEHIDDMLEQLRQMRHDGDPGGKSTEQIDAEIRDFAKRKRETVNALQQTEKEQRAMGGRLIDAARQAAGKAARAGDEAVRVASLIAGKGAGSSQQVSPELMLDLFERIKHNRPLQRMLELVGQLELSMGNKRTQLRKGGWEEIVDIEQGNDLRLVLPAE